MDLAGDQAELGGKHAHCVPEPNETERTAEIWESWPPIPPGHSSWSQPPSADGKVAEMASKETAAAWRCRSYLAKRSEAEWRKGNLLVQGDF